MELEVILVFIPVDLTQACHFKYFAKQNCVPEIRSAVLVSLVCDTSGHACTWSAFGNVGGQVRAVKAECVAVGALWPWGLFPVSFTPSWGSRVLG